MRKFIYLGFLTLAAALLLQCAGMPGYESPETVSFIFNANSQEVVYEKIGPGIGLTGDWMAEDNARGLYSVIQFDGNDDFAESVHSKLTQEVMASYEGQYNVNSDVLEIKAQNGSMVHFTFDIDANHLHLSAK